jgi:thioredoxin reductase (NADPH)
MATVTTKVLIIGAGPVGYTAAIYLARANLKPVLVTGIQPGGQLTTTTDVENFPGFGQAVQGPELMEQMRQQAEHVGTSIVYDTITSVSLSQDPIVAQGDSGDVYLGDTLIIATGGGLGQNGLAVPAKLNIRATVSRPARFATDSSIAAKRSSSSAAATLP